jgi:hypothetical protein
MAREGPVVLQKIDTGIYGSPQGNPTLCAVMMVTHLAVLEKRMGWVLLLASLKIERDVCGSVPMAYGVAMSIPLPSSQRKMV